MDQSIQIHCYNTRRKLSLAKIYEDVDELSFFYNSEARRVHDSGNEASYVSRFEEICTVMRT